MLIEQSAYANRWRHVCPRAKSLFAAGGFVAAFVAGSPQAAVAVAAVLIALTLVGAGVPPTRYLRVMAPALFFLAMSCLSLLFALDPHAHDAGVSLHFAAEGLPRVGEVGARSLAALAALLFLVLTTPLLDLIGFLRRLHVPETLLEIMVVCYRMLFVFSEAMRDTMTAQAARLGYATTRQTLRSLGGMAASLTVQVWQRAHDLHVAAQARNNDGPLRFLEPTCADCGRQLALAALGGGALIALARMLS